MKKNNLILLLTLVLIFSCSKNEPQTLISRWEKSSPKIITTVLERKIANAPLGQCVKDVFSVDLLKAEVKELESKFPQGQRVSGVWKHLDLSQLPIPQANFLKEFGHKLGDLSNQNAINYSSCSDVPCIFNKIYNREETAGYVHYLWYLKFGSLLAADNLIPTEAPAVSTPPVVTPGVTPPEPIIYEGSKQPGEYNGFAYPLADFLFTKDELYGFWRLTQLLKTPYTDLVNLKEIQRIPRKEKFIKPSFAKSCGLAYSSGYILLTSTCLWIYGDPNTQGHPKYKNLDTGGFYESVTHELVHHIDFQQGRGSSTTYRSHRPDYLAISGFTNTEFINAAGVLETKWILSPDAKPATNYGKGSPHENFADTIAHFRVNGTDVKNKTSTEQYSFVSNHYYHGRSFTHEDLMDEWIKENSSGLEKSIFQAVKDCNQNSVSGTSDFFKPNDLANRLLPGVLNCIGNEAKEMSDLLRAKILVNEVEGCATLNAPDVMGKWNGRVKKYLVESFDRYFSELKRDPTYLARIDNFYAQLDDKTMARNVYMSCFGTQNVAQCFQTKIKEAALENASTLSLREEQTEEMAQLYVAKHSFEVIKGETDSFYRSLVQANSETLNEEASKLWEGCSSISQNDDEAPTGTLFRLSRGYLISSFYNCLNANLPETIKSVVRQLSVDGYTVQHAKEELMLKQLTSPYIDQQLRQKYEAEKLKEVASVQEYLISDEGKIRQEVLNDLSWYRRDMSAYDIAAVCKKRGMEAVSFKLIFHQKSELFSDYISGTSCANLQNSPEFEVIRQNNAIEDSLLDQIENEMKSIGQRRAQSCVDQYPMGNILNRVRFRFTRENCLKDDWFTLEAQALAKFIANPQAIKLKISRETFQRRLDTTRSKTQKELISTHFGLY